ncbi:MAG: hypothetical protein ABIT83_01980 [Massilia sp.]
MMRLAMSILWPSFLTAALAELCFFAVFDPRELALLSETTLAPVAIYSVVFLLFWCLCALASMLTCYLLTVPPGDRPPF